MKRQLKQLNVKIIRKINKAKAKELKKAGIVDNKPKQISESKRVVNPLMDKLITEMTFLSWVKYTKILMKK